MLNYGRLVGGFLSEETMDRIVLIVSVSFFSGLIIENGFLCAGWYEKIGLLLVG